MRKSRFWINWIKDVAITGCIITIVIGFFVGGALKELLSTIFMEEMGNSIIWISMAIAGYIGITNASKNVVFSNMAEDIMEINETLQALNDKCTKEKKDTSPVFTSRKATGNVSEATPGSWKCSHCGRNNLNTTVRCGCGVAKGE